jgi:hypothetical protein
MRSLGLSGGVLPDGELNESELNADAAIRMVNPLNMPCQGNGFLCFWIWILCFVAHSLHTGSLSGVSREQIGHFFTA